MIIYVDIDETICDYPIKRDTSKPGDYSTARPLTPHIEGVLEKTKELAGR